MPVSKNPSPVDDSTSQKQVAIPVTGEARIEEASVPGTDHEREEYLAELAFNEEKLRILVMPPTSEHDTARLVSVGVNGEKQYILAGREQWVKRKHVERLVRARPDIIVAEGVKTGHDGQEKNILTRHSISKYNFEVLEDPNPRGPAWLAKLRQESRGQI